MVKTKEAIERGKRLRALREQIGLTRSELSEEMHISEHTIKAFELGTRELPIQKAQEYAKLFLFAGIDVTFEFIYYGTLLSSPILENFPDDSQNIQKEIIYFKSNNPQSLVFKVTDTFMTPLYNKGDMVGGQKISNPNSFVFLEGHICIIEDINGNQHLRRLIKSKGRWITVCTLSDQNIHGFPVIEEIEAFSIAQVTRHWIFSTLSSSSLKLF